MKSGVTSSLTKHATYCRICPATCGLMVDVVDNRVVRAVGDPDHALTRGFTCPKGRRIGDFVASPDRFLTSMRRTPDDGLVPIDVGDAIGEIADRLTRLITEHGPDSVALYQGTQSAFASLTMPFTAAWFAAIGSHKRFSTMTIDQSAKWVADGRLGTWAAGHQRIQDADVWLLAGTNPLVSMQPGEFTGFPVHDGLRRLQAERRRGLQLIVVDPRRTEVAAHADIHLQIRPGTDVYLFGGFLHVLLRDGLHDAAFCERWVDHLDELASAVSELTPAYVATLCGVDADAIEQAAALFGRARRGMAHAGTGPDMGPFSNLAEHLVRSLNVICGRYPREGDALPGYSLLGSPRRPPAHPIGPRRTWETGYRSRLGWGLLHGQLPTATLPDEILTAGDDRVRALIVVGGNPAAALPDPPRTCAALSTLDLLLTIDPYPTETAALAHYVIAPTMHLERPDTTRSVEGIFEVPFAQHTPAILQAPTGTIDEWAFFLRLGWAMGTAVTVAGHTYERGDLPDADEVLASFSRRGHLTVPELIAHPHGVVVDVAPNVAAPADPACTDRFDILPDDVAAELSQAINVAETPPTDRHPLRLIVRRSKHMINTLGRDIDGLAAAVPNECFVHPDDLRDLAIRPGAVAELSSHHGRIDVLVRPDPSLRRGVVALTHGFGGRRTTGSDSPAHAADPAALLSLTAGSQTINAMPQMTAIPVALRSEGRALDG